MYSNETMADIKLRQLEYDKLDDKYNELKDNDAIQWSKLYLEFIAQYDDRYKNPNIVIETIGGKDPFTLHRLMRAMDGIYFAHTININGNKLKVRLLTVKETEELSLEVAEFLEKHPIFQQMGSMGTILLQRKILSLATSVYLDGKSNDEKVRYNQAYRLMTEKEIAEMPMSEFNRLVSEYTRIENEYNLSPEEIDPAQLESFIALTIDEKKSSEEDVDHLLSGLDLSRSQKIAKGYWKIVMLQKANTRFGTSLDNSIIEP